MTNCLHILIILFLEWIGDFLLQSRGVAQKKSESLKHLFEHLFLLHLPIVFAGQMFGFNPYDWALFLWCNIIIHGIVDWNIWKGYKYLVQKRLKGDEQALYNFKMRKDYAQDEMFYATIGLDRFLHVGTIIVLYCVIIGG